MPVLYDTPFLVTPRLFSSPKDKKHDTTMKISDQKRFYQGKKKHILSLLGDSGVTWKNDFNASLRADLMMMVMTYDERTQPKRHIWFMQQSNTA